jgi:anti-sigma B factor antagonist
VATYANLLTMDVEGSGTHLLIRLHGELDLDSAALMRARVIASVAPGVEAVSIDLAGVTFCDSTGFGAFASLTHRLAAEGRSLTLLRPRDLVMDAMVASGMDRVLVVAAEPVRLRAHQL